MNINPVTRLLENLGQNKMPPFLIIETSLPEQFQKDFIQHYQKEFKASPSGVELDLFELKRASDNFKVEQLEPLFEFCAFAPHQWKHRFIFIHEAHLLGEILSNKLLKILEEPPLHYYFIFLAKPNSQFLPTIESRAIKIRNQLSGPSNDIAPTLPESPGDLVEFVKQHDYDVISEALANWGKEQKDGATIKKTLQLIARWQEAKIYHHPKLPMAAEMIHLLSKK